MEQVKVKIFIALIHICSKQLKEVLVSALLVTTSLIQIYGHQLCSCNNKEKGGILLCIPVKLKIIALDPYTYNNPIS